jgi:hypothetical protein
MIYFNNRRPSNKGIGYICKAERLKREKQQKQKGETI